MVHELFSRFDAAVQVPLPNTRARHAHHTTIPSSLLSAGLAGAPVRAPCAPKVRRRTCGAPSRLGSKSGACLSSRLACLPSRLAPADPLAGP